ncbi:hypothetical protein Ndes2526B_g08087 [Nannochloris sp. 'desiccata']|nr:hypothetical protein KSW81_002724 [Chlorella desiccata (nom. nud.)]KAH7617478.1 hypothetical protein NADE_007256 [Chlorella desiccata (nom. nud.)]
MTGGTHLDVQAILPCNAQQYYVERDSAAFRALLSKALSLGVYKFRDTWRDGGSTFVRLVTKPEISSWVPSSVRNAVANASEIEFHDIIEYRPSDTTGPSYTLHVRTESPFLGDKLRVNTTLELIPQTDNTTLQRLSGTVCVRMLGMGGLIEKAIRDNLVKTYQQLPEIVSRWEAYRAELLVQEGDAGRGVLLAGRPPVGGDIDYVRSIMQAPVPLVNKNDNLLLSTGTGIGSPKKAELLCDAAAEAAEAAAEEKEKDERVVLAAPWHMRRRTASELVLDALPTLDLPPDDEKLPPNKYNQHRLPAIVQLAPRHWRGFSWDSVGSQGGSEEAPSNLEERIPGTKGSRTAWKRFNRDYAVWESYWGQVGVHAATAAHQGVARVLHILGREVAAVGRLLAIVVLLLLLRMHILRVESTKSSHNGRNGKQLSRNTKNVEQKRQQQRQQEAPPQMTIMTRRASSSRLVRRSSVSEIAGEGRELEDSLEEDSGAGPAAVGGE